MNQIIRADHLSRHMPRAELSWSNPPASLSGHGTARNPDLCVSSWLALRLAWRQLRHDRMRLASAVAGVTFATILVLMQLGFRDALFDSATNLIGALRADLLLVHSLTGTSQRPIPMPRARAYQALAVPGVARVAPLLLAPGSWRNPQDGTVRTIQVVGVDPDEGVFDIRGHGVVAERLRRVGTMVFDRLSRPEFGPVPRLLAERGAPIPVEIGGVRLSVVGLMEIGPSFAADGTVVMSAETFLRHMRRANTASVDLVAIRLQPGLNVAAVQTRLRAVLPGDVQVLTWAELAAREHRFWDKATPIGFIFGLGSLMGLVVGLVIVHQVLFSDIVAHLREYATLKAIGYSFFYLGRVVLGAALILAIAGFIPGIVLASLLYEAVGSATLLPMNMTVEKAAGVFALVVAMCAGAGLLAARKLRDADPAGMF